MELVQFDLVGPRTTGHRAMLQVALYPVHWDDQLVASVVAHVVEHVAGVHRHAVPV